MPAATIVHTPSKIEASWPDAIYRHFQRVGVRQVGYVPDAGHSALEPGIRAALVNATESFRLSMTDDDLFAPRFPWESA